MKYQQPYGVTDPNASYINGDPTVGRAGSIPPAAAFEYPMRELLNVITNSNVVPDNGDLAQLAKAIRSQALNYLEDSGTVNNIVVSPILPLGWQHL